MAKGQYLRCRHKRRVTKNGSRGDVWLVCPNCGLTIAPANDVARTMIGMAPTTEEADD